MSGVELPPGYANFTVYWQQARQTRLSSTSIGCGLAGSSLDEPDAHAVADALVDMITSQATDATSVTNVYAVANLAGTLVGVVFPYSTGGGLSLDATTPQISVLVRKNTGRLGRTHRGRMYFPPPPEENTDSDGSIDSSRVGAMQLAVNTFVSTYDAITSFSGLYLLHAKGSTEPPDLLLPQPLGLVVEGYVATQRKRSRRGA